MTLAALALVAGAAILLPHALRLRRVHPASACAIWAAALGLRALTALGLVATLVVLLHPAHAIGAVVEWTCGSPIPGSHHVAHLALVAPALLLAGSVLVAAWRVARAAGDVRELVGQAIGRGPGDSVIVGGDDVVLAAAGLSHPTVLVSAGALAHLDDAELAAALSHERGHVVRRHRWVLLYAETCRALARFLPGTTRAARELAFHLERDADRWALGRHPDRLALASAICKSGRAPVAATALGGSGGAVERVEELLEPVHRAARPARALATLAGGLAALVLCMAIVLPLELAAEAAGPPQLVHSCSAGG
jgi:Zn-dependent protease with chaperone function